MGTDPNPETLAAPLVTTGWSVPTTLTPVTRGVAGVPEFPIEIDLEIARAGRELARRTREAQGLPAKVTDKATIRAVVAILVAPKAGGPGA